MPSPLKNLKPVTLQDALLHDVVVLPDKYGFSGAPGARASP